VLLGKRHDPDIVPAADGNLRAPTERFRLPDKGN